MPVAAVETLKTQIGALTAKVNASEMDNLIDTGMSEGKLLPAQEEWARSLDVAALSAYLDSASGVAALSQTQTKGNKPIVDEQNDLTADELAVCTATGISPDEFKKTKDALAA